MSKESFKLFVKRNPELVSFVQNGEMTWQKFYEIYDLYGEDNGIWKKYLGIGDTKVSSSSSFLGNTSLKDLFDYLKNVDLDNVKKGVDGLQKAVGLIQDLTINKNNNSFKKNPYQARPMYKYFED